MDQACGLAISGGGIRSAVFSLGVLQAMADRDVLKQFSYISTVSGGSYIGAFYGSLFVPDELRAGNSQTPSADFTTQAQNASGRLSPRAQPAQPEFVTPIAYLRDNCNYLVPNGLRDYLQSMVFSTKNWFAVQYVIGVTLLTILLSLNLADFLIRVGINSLSGTPPAPNSWWAASLSTDMSAGWARALLPALIAIFIAVCGISPLSRAYWLTQNLAQKTGFLAKWLPFVSLVVVTSLAGAEMYFFARIRPDHLGSDLAARLAAPDPAFIAASFVVSTGALGTLFLIIAWWYVSRRDSDSGKSWYRGSVPSHSARSNSREFVDRVRNALTNAFTSPLRMGTHRFGSGPIQLALWALFFAVVETLGGLSYYAIHCHVDQFWSLQPLCSSDHTAAGSWNTSRLGALAGFAGALWAAARFLLSNGENIVGGLSKVPRLVMASAAAIFAALITLTFWSAVATSISVRVRYQFPVDREYGWAITVLCAAFFVLAIVDGLCIQFLNLSTYQRLYSTRLTRTFLGATNATRLEHAALRDVTSLVAGDSVTMGEYFHAQSCAPVHLINATINKTVDWDSSLVQRGARGLSFSIGPAGMTIGAKLGVLECDWQYANDISTPAHYVRGASRTRDIWLESMTLGDWVAISGAAVSTGLGQSTHAGYSLLLGIANIRLGYWWDTYSKPFSLGAMNFKRMRVPIPGAVPPSRFFTEKLFGTQFCLKGELMGEFDGPRARRWYMTDGGHFENTGAYELLRRELKFIVLLDNGCDPRYTFGDIANLIYRARVDFGVEIKSAHARLPLPPGLRLNRTLVARSFGEFHKRKWCVAIQLLTRFANGSEGQILIIKPRVTRAAPHDVREYRVQNKSFPNETTANQFFDDVQWESHRELGYSQTLNLLT
ncbi:patatin-like phospholipase family protein [Paraburkholderia sacchari]|uniref:patatin-like phospholipase family protein n=1 Tax=Paraburkholderia sacchari TaxID=159450 RepID=UPI0039A50B98